MIILECTALHGVSDDQSQMLNGSLKVLRKIFFDQFVKNSTVSLCVKCTHIGSLFLLTSQSVGISRTRTHTNNVYLL